MKRDKLERVHYRAAHGGTACGRGSPLLATNTRNRVTCKRCLAALMGPVPVKHPAVTICCYKCGTGRVGITPSQGGLSTGELTQYRATCYGQGKYPNDGCGMFHDHLSEDGTTRSAWAHYNRIARAMAGTRPVKGLEK